MTGSIEHVMDTAFWVASDRALEGERPDALFRDPLAAVLAGLSTTLLPPALKCGSAISPRRSSWVGRLRAPER